MIGIYLLVGVALAVFLVFLVTFPNRAAFLSKEELQQVLVNDSDHFYSRFTDVDLHVRHVGSVDEYKAAIASSPCDISLWEAMRLQWLCSAADRRFASYMRPGIDGSVASAIPWKIGFVRDEVYEEGLPHVRGDVIVLPKHIIFSPDCLPTLIHEKVHVYQKMYPDLVQEYLAYNRFQRVANTFENMSNRANPDLDAHVYEDANGEIMIAQYRENPTGIRDVTYGSDGRDQMFEHPLEYMAYTIQEDLSI